MEKWRATRPVDVARLNDGVFLSALRACGVLFLALLPVDVIGAIVVAHHRLPTFGTLHVLAIALPFFLTGFLSHFALCVLGMVFLVAVSSLMWWRDLLAVGGPSAALASATRRVVIRLAPRVDPGPVALAARRDRTTHVVPEHPLLDQLRAALLVAPDAPPSRLAHLADRTVRIDQLISRRAA